MKTNPWFFIPSLYLAEGFPYIVINAVSVILYAQLGYANEQITFWTGILYLPWVIKMFWSPLIDARGTKCGWLVSAQAGISALFLGVAAILCWNAFAQPDFLANAGFLTLSLLGFLIGAFMSATLDIATDGYYLLALSSREQGYFVGVRTIFYRIAMILGSGLLVSAVGLLERWGLARPYNWVLFFEGLALFFAICAVYHSAVLPRPEGDRPVQASHTRAWKESFASYFTQKNIVYILLFILLYRFGEALLEKMVPLFLLKPAAEGGLGLSMEAYGIIKGTLGVGAVITGNLVGGWLLGRYGFKRCIWAFALALNLPNFFYVYLVFFRPSLGVVAALITLEQFGYGLAMMAYTVFFMYICTGAYKTSHYAISTGIMALGMMGPSMMSGWMQARLGYESFFILASIIGLVTFAVIPLTFRIGSLTEAERAFRSDNVQWKD